MIDLVALVYFSQLADNASLPTSGQCANRVASSTGSYEHRPGNTEANKITGGSITVNVDGASQPWMTKYRPLIKGNYTGTTHRILRWGACKWGLDEEITKARAWTESSWRQTFKGDRSTDPADCKLIGKGAPCYTSYGILQVKGTVHEGTYPKAQRSTSFNVDYALAWQRACYDGDFTWMVDYQHNDHIYKAGDVWGCVGAWYSGEWYDDGALDYIETVKRHLNTKPWLGL